VFNFKGVNVTKVSIF